MGEGSLGQARGGKSNEREAVMRESKHPLQRGSRTKGCVYGASSSLKARKEGRPLYIGMGGLKLGDQQAGQLQPAWREQWEGEQRYLSAPRSVLRPTHLRPHQEGPTQRSLCPIIPQICPPVNTSLGIGGKCQLSHWRDGHLRQSCQHFQKRSFSDAGFPRIEGAQWP